MAATPRRGKYSCETASQTLEWMNAIVDFLTPYKPLIDAHVVNFFKDRLWETVDEEWMRCLRQEPVENLLNIPSGVAMEHWPVSLRKFVRGLRSLAMDREPESLDRLFPNFNVAPLGSVVAQGMNRKKKHEVEILAAIVNATAGNVGAQKVIDVGAGQVQFKSGFKSSWGYLAQVLSFEYRLSVIAVDASSHHSSVTNERAQRIKKHYVAKLRKFQCGNKHLNVPQTVTCKVLSSSTLSALSTCSLKSDLSDITGKQNLGVEDLELDMTKESSSCGSGFLPVVLAGLHACGDLSVSMLRNFIECEQVKAVVCIGCCYNLLSEGGPGNIKSLCGFPMSNGAKKYGITFSKNGRDLACQSAERWKSLSRDGALQNFDLHLFRAAFQMVLDKYHPIVLFSNPSIGRKGKALRRQQINRDLHLQNNIHENSRASFVKSMKTNEIKTQTLIMKSIRESDHDDTGLKEYLSRDISQSSTVGAPSCSRGREPEGDCSFERSDRYTLFEKFSVSALSRLGLELTPDIDLLSVWKEAQPFMGFVGPYWSLRAAFGPLLETYLLLDRLLFLQEQGSSLNIMMFPLFDPGLSPRNIAIVARK